MSLNDDDRTPLRRVGRSGLHLPMLSLGLWQNFGDDRSHESQRETVLGAYERGIFHFDLANNYGPPYGQAESNFGRILREDLAAHRDELVVSTKAGWDMWPGPHGAGGSRKHLIASADASLKRLGLDNVDIFYTHRPDPRTGRPAQDVPGRRQPGRAASGPCSQPAAAAAADRVPAAVSPALQGL